MPDQPDDMALWQKVKNGESAALELLYKRYFQLLYNYGRHMGAEATAVEDGVQELFIRLWDRRHTLGQVTKVKAYLISSLRRALLAEKKNTPHYFSDADFELVLYPEKDDLQNSATQLLLQQSLLKLSEKQREIIYLRFFNGLSFQEVAEVSGMKVDTVYKLISRSLLLLRKTMVELPVGLFCIASLFSQLF